MKKNHSGEFFLAMLVFGFSLCTNLPIFADNGESQTGSPAAELRFSPRPTVSEISNARVFDEPLLCIGGEPSVEENKALADALVDYSYRTNRDDFSSLTGFLARFPESAWTGSLLLHLGTEYYNYGYYSKAMEAWEQAWQQFKNADDPKGKAQADRALGELARMYSKLGRMQDLMELLNSTANRPLSGPGTQLIHAAQQGLWMMQNRPEVSFRCGPMALNSILENNDPKRAMNPLIFYSKSSTNGYSMAQVARLSWDLGMNYQLAFRSANAPFVVPSVIHWKVGHYAAILAKSGERYLVKDHTFHSSLLMTATALDQEASGYFLVPPGALPRGWRTVSESEAQAIYGKGNVSSQDSNQTGPTAVQTGGNPNGGDGDPNDPGNGDGIGGAGDPGGSGGGSCGMTSYTMNTMLASLSLNDTPVGYRPPVGPWVKFTATYNQYDANQPATFSYSNLGSDWTCNWISYITDDPASPGVNVTCYAPGGGTLSFTGYNSTTGTFAPELMTQAILRMTSSSSYELQFRSGVKKEFTLSNGSTGTTRLIFLTQVIDPAGNTVQLNYDSSLRITNIVDAIGQATTLAYGNATYPYAITKVTDPFGRFASFQYNAQGLLTNIADVLGLVSQFTYGTNQFINTLTTPYGTTTFTSGTTNGVTWLQATDPLGENELAEATPNTVANSIPTSDPSSVVPVGMSTFNTALDYRDTFFWSKNAFQRAAGVFTNATIYHFLHTVDVPIESGVLERVKQPLENAVWYNYPGQPQPYQLGAQSINRPSAVGRVLDDGTTQLRLYRYNALGWVTNSTDPAGRNFTYVYSTNNVDLLAIRMTSNGKSELQSSFTYNSQHKPLTITDASGQTTTNTYNARGQILTTADPLGETTSFSYDTNGYLLSITGPLQTTNDVTSFTYDAFGRVQTITDTEGYMLTFAYDAMDRMTNVTHPDGTYEQFVYNRLDLAATRDRLGRWTTNSYNADRQLTQRQDPLGRITRYEWCNCGAMTGLIDPMGRQTTWDYDLQSRRTAKHYVDGSTISYGYENTISRLSYMVDEQGQETDYHYNIDDTLASVNYPNAVIPTPTVTYTYDIDYNRLVNMQDGVGLTVYSYNPITTTPVLGAGRLASVSGPLPNSTVTYQYDQLGRVTSCAINGVAQATAYDVLGRPVTVTNALGSFKYGFVDATPRLASEAYPDGQTNLYLYYNNIGDERLLQIQHLYPNGSLLSAFDYAYNAVGQITAWTNQWDTLPTGVWMPGYDAADQLTNVVCIGGPSPVTNYAYAYDPAGNRTLAQSNTVPNQFNYNALNQLAGAIPGFTNSATYEWDAENRLTAINQGANRSEFTYDGLGRRVEIVEKTNGVVQSSNYYLWCGTRVCEQRDGTGANVLRRLFSQGESLVGTTGSTNYFYTRDHLGSVREAVGANGLLATRYNYDPYGKKAVLEENVQTTFGFTGDFVHQKSGLYLTMFRPLDSTSGRWLTRDPIAERGGINLYGFVANNPISQSDPLGLCSDNTLQNELENTIDNLDHLDNAMDYADLYYAASAFGANVNAYFDALGEAIEGGGAVELGEEGEAALTEGWATLAESGTELREAVAGVAGEALPNPLIILAVQAVQITQISQQLLNNAIATEHLVDQYGAQQQQIYPAQRAARAAGD